MITPEQAKRLQQWRRRQEPPLHDQQNHGLLEYWFCSLGRSTHASRQAGTTLGTRPTGADADGQ